MWIIIVVLLIILAIYLYKKNNNQTEELQSRHVRYDNPVTPVARTVRTETPAVKPVREETPEEKAWRELEEARINLQKAMADFDDEAIASIENSMNAIAEAVDGLSADECDDEEYYEEEEEYEDFFEDDEPEHEEKRKSQPQRAVKLSPEEEQKRSEQQLREEIRQNANKTKWDKGDVIGRYALNEGSYILLSNKFRQKAELAFLEKDKAGNTPMPRRAYLAIYPKLTDLFYHNIDIARIKQGNLFYFDKEINLFGLIVKRTIKPFMFYNPGELLFNENGIEIRLLHYYPKRQYYNLRHGTETIEEQGFLTIQGVFYWYGVHIGWQSNDRIYNFKNKDIDKKIERSGENCLLGPQQQALFRSVYLELHPQTGSNVDLVMCAIPSDKEFAGYYLYSVKDEKISPRSQRVLTEKEFQKRKNYI
jgi:hypothetical protein